MALRSTVYVSLSPCELTVVCKHSRWGILSIKAKLGYLSTSLHHPPRLSSTCIWVIVCHCFTCPQKHTSYLEVTFLATVSNTTPCDPSLYCFVCSVYVFQSQRFCPSTFDPNRLIPCELSVQIPNPAKACRYWQPQARCSNAFWYTNAKWYSIILRRKSTCILNVKWYSVSFCVAIATQNDIAQNGWNSPK